MKNSFLDCVHIIAQQLEPIYHDYVEQQQAATWMLEAITQKSEAELLAEKSFQLSPAQEEKLAEWLEKHINQHMPLQYLLGSVPFIDLDILVKPPILIPRPETEEWCYNFIQQLLKLTDKKISILDLCTGTGCIALALAKALPHATVIATDISDDALNLAQKNAQHNKINTVIFIQSDLFDNISPDQKFDYIVSNPPYIDESQWDTLDPMVKNWEDKRALIASDHGLAIIEKIANSAKNHLKLNHEMKKLTIPQLILEIDYDQGAQVKKILEAAQFHNVTIQKDLEGKDRIVCANL